MGKIGAIIFMVRMLVIVVGFLVIPASVFVILVTSLIDMVV